MTGPSWIALTAAVLLVGYTYAGYPLILWLAALVRPRRPEQGPRRAEWPTVSISLPAHNEEHQIADTLDSLLRLDYPEDRLQIVVVSDASTDRTDEIVRTYSDRGVQLVRQTERRGKTAAEDLAAGHLTGEIVVNTDASIRIHRHSLREIVRPFADPSVGVASGRDVSVGSDEGDPNQGEAGYVGYEMWIRDLETRVAGIVGASGSLYAIRREIHRTPLPSSLSRDFAAALHARERGFRAVSVPRATCLVPRTASLRREYRRKVRTMARGMETLLYRKALLNPVRYGAFAWMLFSHKVCRWLVPWAGVAAVAGLAGLAVTEVWARAVLALVVVAGGAAAVAWRLDDAAVPRALTLPAFAVMANVAALHAGVKALSGDREPTWEPTRRTG
ncbi:MAG TPA: glycosyltransferase family 2 protein [Longimicrobiales bacterium]|nr:glycosyltransferase family 2 protein [Longimicrobiales bacterium]